MSDKKNCVMSGMLCCYSGCDFENILICCVGQSDCLCIRHACCLAANVENRGIGMTTNKDAGEICKIGCFCCDYGCVYPKVCCAGVSQCLCCYSVASCPCSDYFLKEAVCALYCLQCIPDTDEPPLARSSSLTMVKQYEVVGRHKPTETQKNPKVYRMKLFANNTVVAKSRFWYYMSLMKKVKRANGEILEIHRINDRNVNSVKNYGIWLRYDSRSGTHNMYKEFRDTSLTGAVDKLYMDMAGRHRARRSSIQIMKTAVLAAADCKRESTTQFHNSKLAFRLLHRLPRASHPRYNRKYRVGAPSTFF